MSEQYEATGKVLSHTEGPWEFQVDPRNLLWILIHNGTPYYRVVWQGDPNTELEMKDVSSLKEERKPDAETMKAGHEKSREGFLYLWRTAFGQAQRAYHKDPDVPLKGQAGNSKCRPGKEQLSSVSHRSLQNRPLK